MVDLFSLALSHGLMALAAWRLIQREDLDADPGDGKSRPDPRTRPMPRSIQGRNHG